MGCPPVSLTDVCDSAGRYTGLSLHRDKMLISRSRYLLLIQTVLSVNGNSRDISGTGRQLNAGLPRTWQFEEQPFFACCTA